MPKYELMFVAAIFALSLFYNLSGFFTGAVVGMIAGGVFEAARR